MENETLLSPPEPSSETPVTTNAAANAAVSYSIITLAIILLLIYLTAGLLLYSSFQDQFSGSKTNRWIDALYFSIVTLSTVGYGDIVPLTPTTKILTIVLVLIGVLFLDFLLNRVVNHVLDLQENAILDRIKTGNNRVIRDHIVDAENERIRIQWKLLLASCVVVVCLGIGALFLYFHERFGFCDSVYLSVISVTTVGYGDKVFKTVQGRLFAVFWLVFSTISMASLFFYCAELRIDRSTAKNLPTCESEYIVSKLKETGKINEDDIKKVISEFENLDRNNLPQVLADE